MLPGSPLVLLQLGEGTLEDADLGLVGLDEVLFAETTEASGSAVTGESAGGGRLGGISLV